MTLSTWRASSVAFHVPQAGRAQPSSSSWSASAPKASTPSLNMASTSSGGTRDRIG
jgi:hypothetical protein